MLSSRLPSKEGKSSFTRKRRARRPSVLSMMRVASMSQRAVTASPWYAATRIRSVSTTPLAVYRCTAEARRRNQGEAGIAPSALNSSIRPPFRTTHCAPIITATDSRYLPRRRPKKPTGYPTGSVSAARALFDLDPLYAVVGFGVELRVAFADGVHDLQALDDLAEDRVPIVEPGCGGVGDKELRTPGVRTRVGHRKHSRLVVPQILVELVPDAVARSAGAAPRRVAALYHKALYGPKVQNNPSCVSALC